MQPCVVVKKVPLSTSIRRICRLRARRVSLISCAYEFPLWSKRITNPMLGRLMRKGTLFRNATTQLTNTKNIWKEFYIRMNPCLDIFLWSLPVISQSVTIINKSIYFKFYFSNVLLYLTHVFTVFIFHESWRFITRPIMVLHNLPSFVSVCKIYRLAITIFCRSFTQVCLVS